MFASQELEINDSVFTKNNIAVAKTRIDDSKNGDRGWSTVGNKNREKLLKKKEHNLYWDNLLKECPHIVTPYRASRIEFKLNIRNLQEKLISKEWINHQKNGWRYVKTIKSQHLPDNFTKESGDSNHSFLPLDNHWGDYAMFEAVCQYSTIQDPSSDAHLVASECSCEIRD